MADRIMMSGLRVFLGQGAWELSDDDLKKISDKVREVFDARYKDEVEADRLVVNGSVPFWFELDAGYMLHLGVETKPVFETHSKVMSTYVSIKLACSRTHTQRITYVAKQINEDSGPRGGNNYICAACSRYADRNGIKKQWSQGVRSTNHDG